MADQPDTLLPSLLQLERAGVLLMTSLPPSSLSFSIFLSPPLPSFILCLSLFFSPYSLVLSPSLHPSSMFKSLSLSKSNSLKHPFFYCFLWFPRVYTNILSVLHHSSRHLFCHCWVLLRFRPETFKALDFGGNVLWQTKHHCNQNTSTSLVKLGSWYFQKIWLVVGTRLQVASFKANNWNEI